MSCVDIIIFRRRIDYIELKKVKRLQVTIYLFCSLPLFFGGDDLTCICEDKGTLSDVRQGLDTPALLLPRVEYF